MNSPQGKIEERPAFRLVRWLVRAPDLSTQTFNNERLALGAAKDIGPGATVRKQYQVDGEWLFEDGG